MKHLISRVFLSTILVLAAVGALAAPPKAGLLRLATTTSTADSGLLAFILPDFQKSYNCSVDVVAVGTGQSLELGRRGDADVVLVHSRKGEDQFVADGFARERFDVMYNDFIVVGPKADPARVRGMALGKDAFKAIMDAGQPFASRGDKSGTHTKELAVWSSLGVTPGAGMKWYNSLGQGMGEVLLFPRPGLYPDRPRHLPSMVYKLPTWTSWSGRNWRRTRTRSSTLWRLAVSPEKYPQTN
jgi:tungstate transport system substrate-binding protein